MCLPPLSLWGTRGRFCVPVDTRNQKIDSNRAAYKKAVFNDSLATSISERKVLDAGYFFALLFIIGYNKYKIRRQRIVPCLKKLLEGPLMTDYSKYVLDENIQLQDASHRIELCYDYQTYPIIIFKDNEQRETIIDTKDTCRGKCECRRDCTLFESLEWADINIYKIYQTLPKRLLFSHVYGDYSGQTSIEEFGKTYNFDGSMLAWGESQRAAFRVRLEMGFHDNVIVPYMGFDFEHVREKDIAGIVYLAKLVQSCTDHKMYLCFKNSNCMVALDDKEHLIDCLLEMITG